MLHREVTERTIVLAVACARHRRRARLTLARAYLVNASFDDTSAVTWPR